MPNNIECMGPYIAGIEVKLVIHDRDDLQLIYDSLRNYAGGIGPGVTYILDILANAIRKWDEIAK